MFGFLIVRVDSQPVHRLTSHHADARCRRRLKGGGLKRQARLADGAGSKAELISGERLAPDDVAQLKCEPLVRREAAGFQVKVPEVETPAILLAAAVLAHQSVEPAFHPPVRSK